MTNSELPFADLTEHFVRSDCLFAKDDPEVDDPYRNDDDEDEEEDDGNEEDEDKVEEDGYSE